MNKILRLCIVITAVIIISGCVPSKPAYENRDIPAGRLIKKMEANRRKVKTFSGNGVLNVKSPELEAKATFEIQLKKPDSLMLSVYGPFGLELAHAIVTNNTFKFYDVLKNKVIVGENDDAILKKIFKIDITFSDLIDVFSGAVNLTDKLSREPDNFYAEDGYYYFTYYDGKDSKTIYTIEAEDLIIENYELYKGENIILSGKYFSFKNINDMIIPFKISTYNDQLKQSLDVEYRNIKINENIDQLKIEYPNDAEIVEWQ